MQCDVLPHCSSEPSWLRWSLASGIQYFYKEEGKRHQDGCGQMQSISPGPPGWMWTDAVYISWISCPGWMWTDAVYITWASWMDMDRCSLYLQHRLQQHRREKDEDDKVQDLATPEGVGRACTLGQHSSVACIGGRT